MSHGKKILLIILYVLLFIFCLGVFLILRFPYQAFIQKNIEQLASRGNLKVTYQRLTLKFPNRAIFENLVLQNQKIPAPQDNRVLELDRLELLVIPYILQQKAALSFSAFGYGGKLKGQEVFGWQEKSHVLAVTFNDLQLEKYPLLKNIPNAPTLEGKLAGELRWHSVGQKQMAGTFKLNIEKLMIKQINMPGLFNEIPFTDSQILLSVKGQQLNIEKFAFLGEVFQLETSGQIPLAPKIEATALDLPIKVTPVFLKKQAAGSNLTYGQQDNSFILYLRGTVQQPTLTPY